MTSDFERYFNEKARADFYEAENARLSVELNKRDENISILIEKIRELQTTINEHHIFSKDDVHIVLEEILRESQSSPTAECEVNKRYG